MREHQDVARGFSKGDKVTQDKLWSKLETSLNASGPPRKEKGEWKKVSSPYPYFFVKFT